MLRQQLGLIGLCRHFALQDLHTGHGLQHRSKAGAHLPINIQGHIQLGVLFQVTQRDSMGHAEFPIVIGVFFGQDLQQGRFSGAVLPHNANAVLSFNTGRHVPQNELFAKALAQFF